MDEVVQHTVHVRFPLSEIEALKRVINIARKVPDHVLLEAADAWFAERDITLIEIKSENMYPMMEKSASARIEIPAKKYFTMSLGNGLNNLSAEFRELMIAISKVENG